MATQNSIKKSSYSNEKQILIAPELAFTIGCQVTNTGLNTDEEGRKILKAGTPVGGGDVLTTRNVVLSQDTTTPVGVVLHDVDVTGGQMNATLVVSGVVDVLKLDSDVQALVTTATSKLSKITFMKGIKD